MNTAAHPYWSQAVHALQPYVPGEQPKLANLVKLNTNELPYGPSPKVLAAIRAVTDDSLRLYPDPGSDRLRAAIAQVNGVKFEQVFVGNGSDEVLAHVFLGLLKHPAPLRFPDITYSFYSVYCALYDIAYETVALREDFRIEPDDYLPGASGNAGPIIIANPNAPTGMALSLAQIERIVAANVDVPVVVDEAYVDFGGESAVALVGRYPNLLVVHTLSKSRALAGLRVGFAMGDADLIQGLDRLKNSFNSYPMDRLAQAGGEAAMLDVDYFLSTCQAVMRSREALSAGLTQLGFEVLPSRANFVFARHPRHDGAALAAALRERGILVRHFKQPRIDQFLRISIGTQAQCQGLLATLGTLVNT